MSVGVVEEQRAMCVKAHGDVLHHTARACSEHVLRKWSEARGCGLDVQLASACLANIRYNHTLDRAAASWLHSTHTCAIRGWLCLSRTQEKKGAGHACGHLRQEQHERGVKV